MKYLIAGLGNIGEKYKDTRHNIGFQVLDALAEASNLGFSHKRHAYTAHYKWKGRTFVLIKPTTYMNLSGKAVNYWLQKENIPLSNLLVIVDDIALPFGAIRLRAKGSSAGHNGLIHIIETLGRQDFARLRFGIGDNFGTGQQADYVLSEWTKQEKQQLPERIDMMIEIIKAFGTIGVNRAMSQYNNK